MGTLGAHRHPIAREHAVLVTQLLGVMLLIFAVSVHLMAVLGGDQAAMSMVLKDTALAGAAFILFDVMASEEGGSEA